MARIQFCEKLSSFVQSDINTGLNVSMMRLTRGDGIIHRSRRQQIVAHCDRAQLYKPTLMLHAYRAGRGF